MQAIFLFFSKENTHGEPCVFLCAKTDEAPALFDFAHDARELG